MDYESDFVEPDQDSSVPYIESDPPVDLDSTSADLANAVVGSVDVAKEFTSPAAFDDVTTPTDTNPIERHDSAASSTVRPGFYWTWKLLSDGYSVDEVAQVRNMDQQTVLEHTLRAAEDRLVVEPSWVLSPTKQTFLKQFVDQHPDQRPAGLLSKLPAGVTAKELLLFLACRPE